MDHCLTIAQAFFPAPAPLESPGGFSYWLLERSALSAIVLAVVGALVMGAMLRRGEAKWGAVLGAIILLAAACVGVVGALVTTDREAIIGRTRLLVRAVGGGDVHTVNSLLTSDAQARMGGERVPGAGREAILNATEAFNSAMPLRECVSLQTQGVVDGANAARTQVNVRATLQGGGPNFSWWLVEWRKDPDGVWRVWGVDCLLLNGQKPSAGMLRMFE